MYFEMKEAIITGAVQSRKDPNIVYLDLHDEDGTYNVSTQGIAMSRIHGILRRPITLSGVMGGSIFNRNQILRITNLDVKAAAQQAQQQGQPQPQGK